MGRYSSSRIFFWIDLMMDDDYFSTNKSIQLTNCGAMCCWVIGESISCEFVVRGPQKAVGISPTSFTSIAWLKRPKQNLFSSRRCLFRILEINWCDYCRLLELAMVWCDVREWSKWWCGRAVAVPSHHQQQPQVLHNSCQLLSIKVCSICGSLIIGCCFDIAFFAWCMVV